MKHITISRAKVVESQRIRKLEEKVWDEEVVNKYDIPMLVRFGYVYVAKLDMQIVGAIIAYRTRDDEIYICDWVVDRKYQGMNIGRKLYMRLIKDVGNKNFVSFVDPTNIPSLKAHQKFGFRIVKNIKNAYNLGEGNRIFLRKVSSKKT